jgi:hypothetical protein
MPPRVRVLERTAPDGGWRLVDDRVARPDAALLVGREGDIRLGVEPADEMVSRHAVRIRHAPDGWAVEAHNRNGVIVHLWGQMPVPAGPAELLRWPRVALRVVGGPDAQHWVLLDDPGLSTRASSSAPGRQLTIATGRPRPLTHPQEQTIRALFGPLLAWPPLVPAAPLQLKQVARQLGVTIESIRRRLEEVRKKATAVGLARVGGLTDPEYLYIIVRAGLLGPVDEDLHPLLRTDPAG